MVFFNTEHKWRYAKLLARAEKNLSDRKTASFMYIMSGCDELYERIDAIYNFVLGTVDIRAAHKGMIEYKTPSWWLLQAANTLFFDSYPVDMQNVFASIPPEYVDLLTEATKYRYKVQWEEILGYDLFG